MSKTISVGVGRASADEVLLVLKMGQLLERLFDDGEDGEGGYFDAEEERDCLYAIRELRDLWRGLDSGAAGAFLRVSAGMSALINPESGIIDPDSDLLDLHPKIRAALAAAAAASKEETCAVLLRCGIRCGWSSGGREAFFEQEGAEITEPHGRLAAP